MRDHQMSYGAISSITFLSFLNQGMKGEARMSKPRIIRMQESGRFVKNIPTLPLESINEERARAQ